jgi:predicted amidohydrolase
MPRKFVAACVQLRSGIERARNVHDAIDLIDKAAAGGAEFIVTPEMTNVLDRDPARLLAHLPHEEVLGEVEAFAGIARKRSVWLLVGSLAVKLGARRNQGSLRQDAYVRRAAAERRDLEGIGGL